MRILLLLEGNVFPSSPSTILTTGISRVSIKVLVLAGCLGIHEERATFGASKNALSGAAVTTGSGMIVDLNFLFINSQITLLLNFDAVASANISIKGQLAYSFNNQ